MHAWCLSESSYCCKKDIMTIAAFIKKKKKNHLVGADLQVWRFNLKAHPQ